MGCRCVIGIDQYWLGVAGLKSGVLAFVMEFKALEMLAT